MINEPDREDTIDFLEKEIGKAEERLRELESINADILAAIDQFLRDEGYSDEEVGEFLCPLVIRLKESPR